ncbi:Zn-ribbon domain-containing OB-fold protein [Nocardia fusca]|uniref:Zn-ribbon domain-containing OB-fold protein n=1 Tax=Nocardia fusca TaxID=941183 RepID=UPI0007A7441C|nr:OB-fold domain-containing protein [Nocardia fusca]
MNIQPVVRDAATAEFFDGAARGVFLLRRSTETGQVLTPSAVQDSVGNTDLEWVEASGRGRVVSWAFVPRRGGGSDTPVELTIGVVELDEGPWWWTQLVDIERDTLAAGLRVRAVFLESGPAETDEYVPVFTPAQDE